MEAGWRGYITLPGRRRSKVTSIREEGRAAGNMGPIVYLNQSTTAVTQPQRPLPTRRPAHTGISEEAEGGGAGIL